MRSKDADDWQCATSRRGYHLNPCNPCSSVAKHAVIFLGNFVVIVGLNRRNNRRNYSIMGKKCFVIALAVFAFGFGTALRSNAGTDMIEPYRAPAPSYN